MDWQAPDTIPEKGDDERFVVYMAFDDGKVRLADWVSYTHYESEYHSNGTYLGRFPVDGDSLYMTDDGYDVRRADDGAWETHSELQDGSRQRHVVVAWMEALRPVPAHPTIS